MGFKTEPSGYIKTVVSELQGAWISLRASVVNSFEFENADKMIFHIDEAMSWESVREKNFSQMKSMLLIIQNIASQSSAPHEVIESIQVVREYLEDTLQAIREGEAR